MEPVSLLICKRCDAAHRAVLMQPRERARCHICGEVLAKPPSLDSDRLLALTSTAAILFAMTVFTPVLSIDLAGTRTQANVWQAAVSLSRGWISAAGVALAMTMALVPMVQLLLLIWILVFARQGWRVPGFRGAMLVLHALRPWSMTEVFLLGVLVAVAKLSAWVHVEVGVGLWSLAGLTVILALLNLQETHAWWSLGRRGGSA
ncbi:MAG TPA: paraquat-inducible protein A [Steroidobacteraceae bacterium]|nr:paraquat-inducible protein A [Steroidobacteraceae bacterium]